VPNLTLLSHGLTRNLELSASVYNLFGERYRDPGSEEHRQDAIVQYGRSFRLKVTVKLPQ
jgi:outer membrane receptor protein involved in Fe transport